MNRFVCHVQLCDGNWGRQVTEGAVADVVESCANVDCNLVRLDFLDPDGDDVLLAFEAEFVTYWSHSEIVRDALIDCAAATVPAGVRQHDRGGGSGRLTAHARGSAHAFDQD